MAKRLFKILDDRGSAMVEGAIMYPMVIIIMVTLIYFAIGEYTSLTHKNESHIRLRTARGEAEQTVLSTTQESNTTDKFRNFGENKMVNITKKRDFGEELFVATVQNQFSYGGILVKGKSKYRSTAFVYVLNEAKSLRLRGLIL